MKKILLLMVFSAVIVACGGDTENTMTVTGTIKGLKKGVLYLQKIPDSTLITIDSIQIEGNGDFTFKTELESPEIFYLYLDKEDYNDINDRITFFGEPGIITINTAWNTFDTKATIKGSKSQEKLEEYRKVMSRYTTKNLEILQAALNPELQKNPLSMDSIKRLGDKNVLGGYLYSINFAINNKDSYISPYIALKEIPDANKKYLDSIHNSLTPEVANSKYGKALTAYLKALE